MATRRAVVFGASLMAGAAPGGGLALAASVPGQTGDTWSDYIASLNEARELMLAQPQAQDPMVRDQGDYLLQELQGVAFDQYVKAAPAYPNIFRYEFTPLEWGWGEPCPDFNYSYAYLDGAYTYRLWGRRSATSRLVDIRMSEGFWGSEVIRALPPVNLNDLNVRRGEDFEIILSPDRHAGRWVELDPTAHNIKLLITDVTLDWENDEPTQFHIERLGSSENTPVIRPRDLLNLNIRRSGRFVEEHFKYFIRGNTKIISEVGYNQFPPPPSISNPYAAPGSGTKSASSNGMGSPGQVYSRAIFSLQPDEALIVETSQPTDAGYWGVHLNDYWGNWIDFMYHQSSLNMATAVGDRDGKVRFVIAHRDPGVPNWIDTTGSPMGSVLMRFKKFTGATPVQHATKVAFNDVRAHLPQETATVMAEERRIRLAQRLKGARKRYGF